MICASRGSDGQRLSSVMFIRTVLQGGDGFRCAWKYKWKSRISEARGGLCVEAVARLGDMLMKGREILANLGRPFCP